MKALLQETKPIKMNANATATLSASSQPVERLRLTSITMLRRLSVLDPVHISPRIQLEISALETSNQEFKNCLRDFLYLKELQICSSMRRSVKFLNFQFKIVALVSFTRI